MELKNIIQEYQQGKSIAQLLKDYPSFNRRQITKLLEENQIPIRGGRKRKQLTTEQISEVKKMIDEGAFLKEVANYCNLDVATTARCLKELGLQIKNTNRINRRIKSNYFSTIDSPIKAYWLGFLFTDEQIYNDLAKYNIIPNKTYLINHIPYQKIPKKYWSAYALGLFDGDGSLSYSKNFSTDVTLNYTAYHETEVQDFQTLINFLINNKKINKNFFTSAWHTQWRGRLQVLKILDVLYKYCPRHLQRKYNKYLSLKNSLK